jgi:Holliday junction resolvase RusA-like endonuclease
MITFFHECVPPTATAQQRRHGKGGKTWQGHAVAKSAATWRAIMAIHRPQTPLQGPLEVSIHVSHPHTAKSRQKRCPAFYKATRPDVDNMVKLALDAMTKEGYWLDDGQVASLHVVKFHADIAGVFVSVANLSADTTIEPINTRPANAC